MINKKIDNAIIDWHKLTGKIPFRMTNDYLFRALMQDNNDVMRILDFELFPENPVFISTYQLYDKENLQRYTDKFTLSVVCLPYIGKATEKDRRSRLTEWAEMFAATEWEELRMIAQQNKDIDIAVTSMFTLFQDDNIREQMIARDEYYAHENYMKRTIEEQKILLDEKDRSLKEKDKALDEKDKALDEKERSLKEKNKELDEKDRIIEKLKKQIYSTSQK